MSDTQVEEIVASVDGETETVEKRTRYTGPSELIVIGEDKVDLTKIAGKGRPAVDLTPYMAVLKDNFKKNAKLPDEDKVQWATYVDPPESVGLQKSRFNSAGAELKIGIRWTCEEAMTLSDGNDTRNVVKLGLVAGKRAEGRGRKPAADGTAQAK